ncbi:MAG TPA: MBL fold metallo-hydrolase [Burkholderiales bacterium]|nr:MBL fold metallo-hydrolase [Burkholderiales bacterium]
MAFSLSFLGAAGTVTGSRYLVEAGGRRLLVDCGLYQGLKHLRLRNWEPFPVAPDSIDAVLLTHAHIDHSGYLPLLVRNGFRGRIHCTAPTQDLCAILLPDSGHLQEEQAEYANRGRFSKHSPALPLYTQADAERCLAQIVAVPFDADVDLGGGCIARFSRAGHILGAAFVTLAHAGRLLVFSGDLGRPRDPIMPAPARLQRADYLVLESTYGDRLHDGSDPAATIGEVVNRTVSRGGVIVVPVFAVGRAQELMYYLHRLKSAGTIPDVPVYLNSPMAVDAGRVFREHAAEHRLSAQECDAMFATVRVVNSADESRRLNRADGPKIILAASGMAEGGRVVHHLKAFAPDARNTILFTGFQAAATRGAAMIAGADSVKIHGEYVPVRAQVVAMSSLSAHADYAEIMQWISGIGQPPRQTFLTHGEPVAADALRHRIEESLHWRCRVAEYRDVCNLE